jgi:hypothetical protein
MTQPQFETLYNQRRAEMNPPRHKETFNLMKSKITIKATFKDVVDEHGRPSRVPLTKAVSKKVFDTNKFNELCQAVWEYYTGTKLKRISSEGKWRPNVGFIKNENRGFADLHGIYSGRAIYIETKQSKENHLDSQKEFSEWVTAGGGIYVSVRSFDDIWEVVQAIMSGESVEKWAGIKQAKRKVDDRPLFV